MQALDRFHNASSMMPDNAWFWLTMLSVAAMSAQKFVALSSAIASDGRDMAGAETWFSSILDCIERIQAQKPAEGEAMP